MVAERAVHRAALVPEGEVVRSPAPADGALGGRRVVHQEAQHRLALGGLEPDEMAHEITCQVQTPPSGDRMPPDERMRRAHAVERLRPIDDGLAPFAQEDLAIRLADVVVDGESGRDLLHLRGERVEGLRRVDPHRVAAAVRDLEHRQERHDRRLLDPADVAMPAVGLGRIVGAVLDELERLERAGRGLERIDAELAEAAGGGDVVRVAHPLLAQEDQAVGMDEVLDHLRRIRIQEVDAAHDRAEVLEQRLDLDPRNRSTLRSFVSHLRSLLRSACEHSHADSLSVDASARPGTGRQPPRLANRSPERPIGRGRGSPVPTRGLQCYVEQLGRVFPERDVERQARGARLRCRPRVSPAPIRRGPSGGTACASISS
jgi:hypothetical protein